MPVAHLLLPLSLCRTTCTGAAASGPRAVHVLDAQRHATANACCCFHCVSSAQRACSLRGSLPTLLRVARGRSAGGCELHEKRCITDVRCLYRWRHAGQACRHGYPRAHIEGESPRGGRVDWPQLQHLERLRVHETHSELCACLLHELGVGATDAREHSAEVLALLRRCTARTRSSCETRAPLSKSAFVIDPLRI